MVTTKPLAVKMISPEGHSPTSEHKYPFSWFLDAGTSFRKVSLENILRMSEEEGGEGAVEDPENGARERPEADKLLKKG